MSVKVLEQAIYSLLSADAGLTALAGQGVWNTFRPEEEAYDHTKPLTWVTFTVENGGDTNDASGDRFKDVRVRIGGHVDGGSSVKLALDIDDYLGGASGILIGWIPTLAGWPAVWKTERVDTFNYTAFDEATVVEHFQGAVYRFQYGKAT